MFKGEREHPTAHKYAQTQDEISALLNANMHPASTHIKGTTEISSHLTPMGNPTAPIMTMNIPIRA